MESILTSVKKFLGPSAEYEHFDPDIIMHINSVFMDLNDLGIGPEKAFVIEDDTSEWTDFFSEKGETLEAVKSYMYLRVKLLFDPPASSATLASMERQIDKWEWKLNVRAENARNKTGGDLQ